MPHAPIIAHPPETAKIGRPLLTFPTTPLGTGKSVLCKQYADAVPADWGTRVPTLPTSLAEIRAAAANSLADPAVTSVNVDASFGPVCVHRDGTITDGHQVH